MVDGKTGIFFKEQSTESVKNAILDFESKLSTNSFDSETILKHAEKFSKERFCMQIKDCIDEVVKTFR